MRTLLCLLIPVLVYFSGCSPKKHELHPIEKVIGSMSDSLPRMSLPDDADPADENWSNIDLEPKSPVLPLYPEEEQKHFLLPPGYRIEPVLTEPQIEQPGAIAFDGDGRMYVLELRSYMLTADSDGTLEPVSRISRWEDADNDGVYEKGTAFVDSLIFPRFVLPYGKNCILTMESDADNVYKYTDTNDDGKADKKELFTTKYGRSGNVEHQQAFMYRGMDNWIYSTVNAFRIRESPGGILREKTGYNRAQWGITHDDFGKLWFQGGASGLPSYFQFPIHYGNFTVEDEFAEGFKIPWGAPVKIADMQGGMDEVRQPDGSLNNVTGAAGNDIFRGDRLPKALYGQYFYGEPVARIVRQINPVVTDGLTRLHNVYQEEQSEFLRSTDPLFRPVDMTTAPDGTLYITDMYHGIIQEGQWAQKGTYLRSKIEQYQLDKVVGLGRIWRITYDGMARDKKRPAMLDKKPSDLLTYLGHPNGWWRDKAQQLIVLSGNKSLVPALESMAREHANPLARIHALWCLEGLGGLKEGLVNTFLEDSSPKLRIQGLRAAESLRGSGGNLPDGALEKMIMEGGADEVIQAMLTAKFLEIPNLEQLVRLAIATNKFKGVQVIGEQILNPPEIRGFNIKQALTLTSDEQERVEKGALIFNELCVQCHGNDGLGTIVGNGQRMAPPLKASDRIQAHPDYAIHTVLHGLKGPIDGKTYAGGIMVGMEEQSDDWIAAVTSYIRYHLENGAGAVSPEAVAKIREKTKGFEGPYDYETLMEVVPQQLLPLPEWKVRASHTAPARIGGTASPASAFNFEGWTTGEQQRKGMWFEVGFPRKVILQEVHFNSPSIRNGRGPEAPPPTQTFPRKYQVLVSADNTAWEVVAEGGATSEDVVITFDPVEARYLKILLPSVPEATGEFPWSMRQMTFYGWPQIKGATGAEAFN